MSTRSTFTIINPDLSAEQVYCHNDGYLAHNGMILQLAYNSPQKAAELISGGDMSSVGYTPKQSKIEKDIDTLDHVNVFSLAEKLGFDIDSEQANEIADDWYGIIGNSCFYYNRDRHENSKSNLPQKFSPKETKQAIVQARRFINKTHKINDFSDVDKETSPVLLPDGMIEYNYVYNASSAHPSWYVIHADDVTPESLMMSMSSPMYLKWSLKPLNQAIKQNVDKKDIKGIEADYRDFKANQSSLDITYNQFVQHEKEKFN